MHCTKRKLSTTQNIQRKGFLGAGNDVWPTHLNSSTTIRYVMGDPSENGPQPPAQVIDADDADTNPEMEELVAVPKETPIVVNTSSGRELIIKFTEDCYIAASLAESDNTVVVAAEMTTLVMMLANLRYGGLEEARDRWARAVKGMEVSGG